MTKIEHRSLQSATDDEIEFGLDIGAMLRSVKRHYKKILAVALVGIFFSATVALVYKEKYVSTATIFLQTDVPPSVVNQFGGRTFRLMDEVNPFKSQEELLKSQYLMSRVLDELHRRKILLGVKKPAGLAGYLKAKHLKGTLFIQLTATAKNAKDAQQIANTFLDVYHNVSEGVEQAPLRSRRKIILSQLDTAQKSLSEVIQKMQAYQQANGLVDVSAESHKLVERSEDLKKVVEEDEAALAEKTAESEKIQKQLNIDLQTALNSVASGGNKIYDQMVTDLAEMEQEYATKSLTLAKTHPYMVRLRGRISALQKQMEEQLVLTLGEKSAKLPKVVIQDEVRIDLVGRLAAVEAEKSALENKLIVNREQLAAMQLSLDRFPAKQVEYNRLDYEQRNLRLIIDRLEQGLAEVKVQESYRTLYVYSRPSLPENPVFPLKKHILFAGSMASILLPTLLVMLYSAVTTVRSASPNYLEYILEVPVLSIIPWLPKEHADLVSQDLSQAYQALALNLRAQEQRLEKKALAVASVYSVSKKRSSMLVNLGLSLAQSGEKVIMVDANIRQPRLTGTFGLLEEQQGLSAIIETLAESAEDKLTATEEKRLLTKIQKQITDSNLHESLDFLVAGFETMPPFELLNSKGFELLVKLLRKEYDWVLFDAPAMLAGSESYAMLKHLDGVLLFVENNATPKQVEDVCYKVHQVHSTVVGAVMRQIVG